MRVALSVIGVLGAFFAPPWVPLISIVALALRFPAWEGLLIGFLVDLLWLPEGFLEAVPLFTIAALILVWGLEPLRRELLVS